MSQPKIYPYTKPAEDSDFCLFPDCLEDDDLVFFHGTLDKNRQDIIRDGFRPAPDGDLVRVTYATVSKDTLQQMFYKLKDDGDRCVFAVRFESTSGPEFCQEGPLMRVHKTGPQPTVVGYMVIPFADKPT
jgi:hypothetical protein